jgi:hypothetical protein
VLWGDSSDSGDQERLVTEIDRAIQAHVAAIDVEAQRASSPEIFVSHRHKDQKIAEALTETIRSAFNLPPEEIRCTSVQPYRLPFGKNTSERLRSEIGKAKVVLGILSPDTAESSYVMFELGAAWSMRIYTCPLLSRGAEFAHIPGPIYDLAPAKLWVASDCHQLLENLQVELDLDRSQNTHAAVSQKIETLTNAAKSDEQPGG